MTPKEIHEDTAPMIAEDSPYYVNWKEVGGGIQVG